MKILAFTPYYPPHTGGLEEHASELFTHLSDTGNEVTAVTTALPQELGRPDNLQPTTYLSAEAVAQEDNLNIIRLPAAELVYNYPTFTYWQASTRRQLSVVYRTRFDVIISITRFFLTSLNAAHLARRRHTPWLHIEHGSDHVTSDNPLISTTARLVDATVGRYVFTHSSINVAPSKSAKRFIQRYDTRDTPVIYRGLPFADIDRITPDTKLEAQHREDTLVVYAGRLISGKGVADLITAFNELSDKQTHLLIIGDGDQRTTLQRQAAASQQANAITFAGTLSHNQTIAALKAADIVVNPSYNEGMPTTVLEAAACRKAIIATNVGGTPEAITHQQSGLLFKPSDIRHLTGLLAQLAADGTQRQQLGQAARAAVAQKFNWSRATQQYQEILQQIAS